MKRCIQWLFGKPYKEDKFLHFFYRSAVVFYFIGIFLFFAFAILANMKEFWIALFMGGVFFPILFRVGYRINIKLAKFARGTHRR